jgi:hypothetical protein
MFGVDRVAGPQSAYVFILAVAGPLITRFVGAGDQHVPAGTGSHGSAWDLS